ncbi:DEAD/DEAH box helicase [Nocardioides sp. CFH 31398]|uniref:DEAD/DEAH box helicase n=1 Tax=Nocardioides sp. CFH 31398 TaxID=2919579 RepID=UPI001F05D0A7|nr:DEAD/DEAH box helicase [Nocardioides sp. CFH 31398]MCH1867937.1 DEAD/DEAH box helicase [Nocardioides sp. CFH 31398]
MSSDSPLSFPALGVPESLAAVLSERGITTPTPIQAATLPDSLAGRDVLGRGRTGSGKTYAFLLPLVARLVAEGRRTRPGRPRALVLAPTRELVGQIHESLKPLAATAGLTVQTVFGGVGQGPQVTGLKRGADVVLACPGRLEDLMGQGHVSLGDVSITVLDEADHMADLGFLPGVRRILTATAKDGQRLLFSATLDNAIDVLVQKFLRKPVTHEADSVQAPVTAMSHHVLHLTSREQRVPVLADLAAAPGRTVVFTRTKHGAKGLAKQLNRRGVPAVELHGNLSQGARTRNLDAFHSGRAQTLVATDIAARGIHVDDVALVVHADPPVEHKAYLHRSGRTARAGAAGTVVTLMLDEQVRDVRALTRAAGISPVTTKVSGTDHPVLAELAPGERTLVEGGLVVEAPAQPQRGSGSGGGGRSGGGRNRRRGSGSGSGSGGGQKSGGQARQGSGSGSTSGGQGGGRSRSGGSRRRAGGSGSASVYTTSSGGHSAASFSSGRR